MKTTYKTELTYKEMKEQISEVFLVMRQVRIHMYGDKEINEKMIFMENSDFPYLSIPNKDISKRFLCVRQSLFALDEESRKIIINEFYYKNPYWWEEYYSRSTFYRKKKNAMIAFLRYFNFTI